ncbi:hypothetical protein [Undibacterium sp. YM2]|uniref:hypothetical protein n=1 Tax=Undibacterium sp. YM2 TaxID=2058625 RepID=UPI0013897513|nr:hypothetical protein [Undibacterium sp. YM2]
MTDENLDTYFLQQPQSAEEIEQACSAIEVCCVDALRYGGKDPKILMRLKMTNCCDHASPLRPSYQSPGSPAKKWWQFWK